MNRKRTYLTGLLIVFLSIGLIITAEFTEPAASELDDLDAFVQYQMEKHRIPGVALVVIEDGQIAYAQGYGSAGPNRRMTADTPMSIGSITKSFTAMAVLQLVEQGRINLDVPVREYLPWFQVADPTASQSITVRHLLQHTSGLSEFGYNRVHHPNTSLEEGVRDLRVARLTAPIGETYQYFQPNYQTLALIIETVSGQSYGAYVTEHIFRPLRMTNSYSSQVEAQTAGMAQGYSKLFGFPVAREHPFRHYMLAAGYLISNARDLSHFLIAMENDGVYEGARILSPASVALMKTPMMDQQGGATAMAWGFSQYHDRRWERSAGADETFMSEMLLDPKESKGVIWLMNQQHLLDPVRAGDQFNQGLTALLLGQAPEPGGLSMRLLGFAILVVFIFSLVATVKSFTGLRGWAERTRELSTTTLVRQIAPHFLIPAAQLVMLYRFLGPLLFGTAWTFNIRYVGLYMIPDIALLMFLAIVPDLIQGLYKTVSVVNDRLRFTALKISRMPGRSASRKAARTIS